MAIQYTQAFNGGELSRRVDGRSDFDVYRVGCRKLDNFIVLDQGGVERRAGTEFIRLAGTAASTASGSSAARMIEFDFSSDIKYVIELGQDYANIHYESDGTSYIVQVTETDNINYTAAELRTVQFTRRYDTLVLSCPTKQTMLLERTSIAPAFRIREIAYVYPPLMDKNSTDITINPTAPTDVYTGTTTLVANSDIFFDGMANAHWAIDHRRLPASKDISLTVSSGTTKQYSDFMDVSFSQWSYEDTGTFEGIIEIERRVAGASTVGYVTIGNTSSGPARNFKFASDVPEDANTQIRIAYTRTTGSFTGTLTADNFYHKGLVKITDVKGAGESPTGISYASGASGGTLTFTFANASAPDELSTNDYVTILGVTRDGAAFDLTTKQITNVDASANTFDIIGVGSGGYTFALTSSAIIESSSRAAATVVSMMDNAESDPSETKHWYESAFSTYRGFSPTSEFFENRLWLGGSKDEPADLFGSVFDDIFNFLPGSLSTDAIKRKIDSPEEPKWLEGKRFLFLGTTGTAVSIRSANQDELITQSNITTLVENAYGSAALQAEIVNDVIVYVQRDKLKLRELVYSQNQDTFLSNDLNILSTDITESGVQEMFIQKEPSQLVWCIKDDGNACVMTYDRGQNVRAWTNITTDGDIFSGAAIHDTGEDVVWVCVNRGTTSSPKYCIEKFHLRKDLNWYVDSGKEFQGTGSKSGNAKNDISEDYLTINITGHGYSTGDFVNIESSTYSDLTGNNYEVEKVDDNNFFLRIIGTTTKVPVKEFSVSGTTRVNGSYLLDRGFGDLGDLNTRYTKSGTEPGPGFIGFTPSQRYISLRWLITQPTDPEASDDFAGAGVNFVWDVSWGSSSEMGGGSFADGSDRAITVKQVNNKVTGLDHLDGKTVQVLVDDNYVADKVVSSGTVTVDEYGAKVTAGLPYISTLQPMPIEPALMNKLSQSRVKAAVKIIVRFFKTKGAAVGEAGKQLTTYSVLNTQDALGQTLEVKSGQQRFFTASDYDREKLIEVRQDLPYPMTVLSIATHINAEGA